MIYDCPGYTPTETKRTKIFDEVVKRAKNGTESNSITISQRREENSSKISQTSEKKSYRQLEKEQRERRRLGILD